MNFEDKLISVLLQEAEGDEDSAVTEKRPSRRNSLRGLVDKIKRKLGPTRRKKVKQFGQAVAQGHTSAAEKAAEGEGLA